MHIFVFTPVYRLEPQTIAALFALRHDGPITWHLQRDNPHADGRENILHQYRQGRAAFLAGAYDAMLVIESDIIPPYGVIPKLLALDADVAYGVYRFRVSNVINIFERYPGNPRNEGESLSIYPHKLAAARRAGSIPCSGGGLGCTLIKRHVLEALDFRLEETAHCDTYFNRDLLRQGYRQMADMSAICGHVNEAGEVLWPF